jgi:hypothetical protein
MKASILEFFEETFENPRGIYLDRPKGALFLTLESISAAVASKAAPKQRNIAAHVEHLRVYLVALHGYLNGADGKTDWEASWQTQSVSSLEWQALQDNLKTAYQNLLADLRELPDQDPRLLEEPLAIVVHTAYHFGAIRQLVLQHADVKFDTI